MKNKKGRAPVCKTESAAQKINCSQYITDRKKRKKETERRVRIANEMGFKKYNPMCDSVANHTEDTGVQRVPALERAVNGEAFTKRAREKRRDAERLSCWLSESLKTTFKTSRAYRGLLSDKDYITYLIEWDAKRIKAERQDAVR